ncbi:thiamine pyrophosphate-dependent enzyme [Variovorax humicola]|uniref:thiamine pyrophosphate-dependent enzyme n=1 Tax=Variovorax humicola TaxID=1769758 RepID=UPI003BF61AE3
MARKRQEAAGAAKVRGPLHLSTGQEAVPAGVCAHLTGADYLTSTHLGHGHTLAKGADLTRMMCELFGKAAGFNGGKGGSMHIADFSAGMLGANGVMAAGCRSPWAAATGTAPPARPLSCLAARTPALQPLPRPANACRRRWP